MAKVLIVYATGEGQTRKIASRMADRMRSGGHLVDTVDVRSVPATLSLASYDGVVVGASIHYESHPSSIKRFVKRRREELLSVRTAFFSVSLSAGGLRRDFVKYAEKYVARFLRATRWRPAKVTLFGGALLYTKYSLWKRVVLWLIAKLAGGDTDTSRDYEYTDWAAVDELARDFSMCLPEGPERSAQGTSIE